ncbi:haloacid dehalogenase, type II [Rubrobacter xylanophilus DSM 9941]|uniref:Haloacid dehalogenase, type II n=1 Tax=Rubrobacter xylanophilus (strain DSM 9941 / JCM 11954 / NBRC 16129 / PRD-1) TaxID=266117 RepID=Q1AVE4_RUBXD|nr:haloacid dehalogenase type II [Rubrobacter xylanophilus]ABG04634.1 haloacid dehalogenase, type II [Rubrobacter xylanophilus DSM 9941]
MPQAVGLDVYGTLVDPLQMDEHLGPLAGEKAGELAALWRQKQLEYAFRRGLMRRYEDFGVCTRQALQFATRALGVELPEPERRRLLEAYGSLPPFPDAAPALSALKERGHRLWAFSNGLESAAQGLLANAGLLEHLEGVVSVDDLRTFKPAPEVYLYLARRLERRPEEVWLVSGNPFDVIGAKAAGLKAAWVRRDPAAVFDPWGIEPDVTVPDLAGLAGELPA